MVDNAYMWSVILVLCAMIFITRALPFLIAPLIKNSQLLQVVGKSLPAYVMMLLVIYEIKPQTFIHYPYGIPALLALIIVIGAHVWRRNVLISISCGTLVYALLMLWM